MESLMRRPQIQGAEMYKTVEEYTSINPVMVDLNASLEEAMDTMRTNGIRHLLVQENGNVVGIISERDLLANYGKVWATTLRVKSVMKTDLLYAYQGEGLSTVAYRLSSNKKGSAIVLDSNSEVYGIFTTTDALNALVES